MNTPNPYIPHPAEREADDYVAEVEYRLALVQVAARYYRPEETR